MQRWSPMHSEHQTRVGVVSTYPPTRCGIARFAASFYQALTAIDPALNIDVLRLIDSPGAESSHPVSMEIDPVGSVGIRAAAKHLNRGDIAVLNHEFGLFGPDDGPSAVDLARSLEVPALTILHTVVPDPTARQREIIQEFSSLTTTVVMCEAARDFLIDNYSVAPGGVEVVAHGAHWSAQRVNHPPRRQVITWGLLGPGKGLERSLAAMAQLDLDPPVTYRIVGRTHPNVVRNAGHVYRHSLNGLVEDLGLSDRVEFIDRYVADQELVDLVRGSDVVVAPYDNQDQVSSGVITEAIGLGRPVVATRFPYSEELLRSGAGLVVDHDAACLAEGIASLLEDSVAYQRAAREAGRVSADLSWPNVARQYAQLVDQLAASRATA